MILGKNRSSGAEILFAYIVVEKEESTAEADNQQTSERDSTVNAEADAELSKQASAGKEGMHPATVSDASSEEFKPSDSSCRSFRCKR